MLRDVDIRQFQQQVNGTTGVKMYNNNAGDLAGLPGNITFKN